MVISKLILQNFEGIGRYEIELHSHYAVIDKKKCVRAMKALGEVLHSDFIRSRYGYPQIDADTLITAELVLDGAVASVSIGGSETGEPVWKVDFTILRSEGLPVGITALENFSEEDKVQEYLHMITQCPEEDSLNVFVNKSKMHYGDRFHMYMDPKRNYPEGKFTKLTDGIGDTVVFRNILRKYEQSQEETPFLNFIKLNSFWTEVSRIRDMHFEEHPLIISELPEDADWRKAAEGLDRQIIVAER